MVFSSVTKNGKRTAAGLAICLTAAAVFVYIGYKAAVGLGTLALPRTDAPFPETFTVSAVAALPAIAAALLLTVSPSTVTSVLVQAVRGFLLGGAAALTPGTFAAAAEITVFAGTSLLLAAYSVLTSEKQNLITRAAACTAVSGAVWIAEILCRVASVV